MENETMYDSATQLLLDESEQILQILKNQEANCTSCPIFEEIMDTKLFGFSEKVNFAIELGVIEDDLGQQLLSNLERAMSEVYENIAGK
ncbi:DUF1507 family protein [Carnobacteriaceae bacterium 52-44]